MRLSHIKDYLTLRKFAENPGDTLRFGRDKSAQEDFVVRMRDGRRVTLRPQARDYHIFRRIFLDDTYRIGPMGTIPGCVLDIGANAGLFACRVAPQAGRILCYEPSTANYTALERNLATVPQASPRRAAVAGTPGNIRLYIPDTPDHSGQSSLFSDVDGLQLDNYEEVPATTLDEIFSTENIEHCGLLKIDVEGAEYEILAAASSEVFAAIDAIRGEYHHVDASQFGGMEELAVRLRDAGYHVDIEPHRKHPGHGLFFARRQ